MKRSEKFAATILEGQATWLGTPHPFDIYWNAQNRRVEVKTMNIKSSDIGKKILHADLHNNWDKNDYYMLMVYIDDQFDHCYLIGSANITNRQSKSKSITIPKNWDNFEFRNKLYAFVSEKGLHRI